MLSLKKTPWQNMNNHFNKCWIAHKHKGQFSRHRLGMIKKNTNGDSPSALQFIPKLVLIHWVSRLLCVTAPGFRHPLTCSETQLSSEPDQVLMSCLCLFPSTCIFGVSFQTNLEALTTGKIFHLNMPSIIKEV